MRLHNLNKSFITSMKYLWNYRGKNNPKHRWLRIFEPHLWAEKLNLSKHKNWWPLQFHDYYLHITKRSYQLHSERQSQYFFVVFALFLTIVVTIQSCLALFMLCFVQLIFLYLVSNRNIFHLWNKANWSYLISLIDFHIYPSN